MFYGLVAFPDVDLRGIQQIRRKYDPTFDLIDPHIAVMFPVDASIGEENLVQHLHGVLDEWKPFSIHIHGFHQSWDQWLFLTVEEGRSAFIRLNRDIYTDILAKYRRDDIEYIPHISLGLFVKDDDAYDFQDPQRLDFDEDKYHKALQEAKGLSLDFRCEINRFHLVKINDDFTRIVREKVLRFGAV
jgi:2'-5' RNA ligase